MHWREEEYIYPPESFVEQANADDPAIFDRFGEKKFPDCFTEYADLLSWDKKWDTVLDTSNPPFWKWFTGGRLNASYNCVDRHCRGQSRTRPRSSGCPNSSLTSPSHVSYARAAAPGERVRRAAARLRRAEGRRPGHAAHADGRRAAGRRCWPAPGSAWSTPRCSAGSAGNACGTRIADSGSRVLITMDGYYRAGHADRTTRSRPTRRWQRRRRQGQEVDKVLVWRRHPGQYASATPMVEGRDFFVDEVLRRAPRADRRRRCPCRPRRRCS